MMLIENVTDQTDKNRQVNMTHEVKHAGTQREEHFVRVYKPNHAAGPFAGDLVASYVLSREQAAELKRHL